MQYLDYLNRIKQHAPQPPSYHYLCELQTAHITHIPWENLDVYFKKGITLEIDYIINKFVKQQRGGLCFELNGAYHQLLLFLGFKATLVPARIFGFHDKTYVTPRDTHIVILVELDNKVYVTDVSWDGFRHPLSLSGEVLQDISGIHRAHQDNTNNYYVEKKINGIWHRQYQVFTEGIPLTAVLPHLNYSSASQEREAAHQLLYTQHTANGYISLVNDKITLQENHVKHEYDIETLGGLHHVLTKIFHIQHTVVSNLLHLVAH